MKNLKQQQQQNTSLVIVGWISPFSPSRETLPCQSAPPPEEELYILGNFVEKTILDSSLIGKVFYTFITEKLEKCTKAKAVIYHHHYLPYPAYA